MERSTKQQQTVSHDEIAMVARKIWQEEGCQKGRDLEYWLKAERQILASTPRGQNQVANAPVKGSVSVGTGKIPASQSAMPMAERRATARKRASARV